MNWPPNDELLASWERLKDDPLAGGAFVVLTLAPLTRALTGWRQGIHADNIETAAADAVLWLVKNPDRYDPAKSPLSAFLFHVARCRLINQFAAERRHQLRKIPWDNVEIVLADGNEEMDDDTPSFNHPELQAVIASLSDVDRQLLDLMRDGERSTVAFATVMGIADRPADEQEREVKRAKDRIKARLKRAVGGSNG